MLLYAWSTRYDHQLIINFQLVVAGSYKWLEYLAYEQPQCEVNGLLTEIICKSKETDTYLDPKYRGNVYLVYVCWMTAQLEVNHGVCGKAQKGGKTACKT